ncbi:hypothetical protein J2X71_003945 [Rhizobium sp. 1399]|nr:hypothetical protein [Rhizobium sp. 1399]
MRTDILKGDILHLDPIGRPVEGDEVAVSNGPEWPLTSSPNVGKRQHGLAPHPIRQRARERSRDGTHQGADPQERTNHGRAKTE